MATLIGQVLGQYEVTALVGEGGMATVYQARQESMKRNVAIKVIESKLASNPDFVKRFEREAQTVASLSHSHILKVFDYGRQEDLIYLVMELLTGGSLADLIGKGPLPPATASRLLDQIASALDYAHRRGIIHRDLKPQNVLLDDNGDAHLTDFGIAKILSETTALTMTGVAIGTPAYMAPEQWAGTALDARADIYSLGVMLFEMMTGQLPFKAETPASMMYAHINEPPPVLDLRFALPQGVAAVIQKALAKDRENRYASAGELASALRSALAAPAPSDALRKTAPPTAYEIPLPPLPSAPTMELPLQPRRKGPPILGLIGGIVIVALIGAVLFLLNKNNQPAITPSSTAVIALVASETASAATTSTPDPTALPTVEPTATVLPTTAPTTAPTVQAAVATNPTASIAPSIVPGHQETLDAVVAGTPTAVASTAAPTDTPVPPTDTFTPDPTSTFTSTATLTVIPTITVVPTSTPTLTITPTVTASPSLTPTTPPFDSNVTGWKTIHPGGTWQLTTNGLLGDFATGQDSFYIADASAADFTYAVSFTMIGGGNLAGAGVMFRSNADPLKGSYLVRVNVYNGGEISLVKFFPVKQYKQLALKNLPIKLNTPYTIRVVATGPQITVYLNDQQVLQATDSDYLHGTVGLNIYGSTTIFTSAKLSTNAAGGQ